VTRRGKFVSLEGGEGVGKSTQREALAVALRARGLEVVETREPGGSEGAEKIRDLLLDPREDWADRTEALLFAAARAEHVERTVRPALDAGRWVLSDRFIDSSLAYQGGAGGLGIEAVREINAFGIGETFPDRTLVLVLDVGCLSVPVRYDDPAQIYPHVYGPIDRAAIVGVLTMPRDASGAYLSPA